MSTFNKLLLMVEDNFAHSKFEDDLTGLYISMSNGKGLFVTIYDEEGSANIVVEREDDEEGYVVVTEKTYKQRHIAAFNFIYKTICGE